MNRSRTGTPDIPAQPALSPPDEWHALETDRVAEILSTDAHVGLTPEEVRRRREKFGPNVITRRAGQPAWIRFLLQFHAALIYILLAAGFITAILGEWVDSGVIFGVVVVNAIVGFVQESRAIRAIEALARSMSTAATVIREGERRRIPAEGLVPGDVVVLGAGDKVPADLRLVECKDLHADESALTGESVPVSKRPDALPAATLLADRRNMVYASSLIARGHATGIVVGTGDQTEVGRISGLISTAEQIATPLTRKIAQFSRLLMWLILGVAAAMFVVGLFRGMPVGDTFMAAVALAVGAIPEGLPAAITIMLAIGVSRMATRRAIVRKLPAVEALGSTTVICSDKTGTLTQNQMTVQAIVAGGERIDVTGAGYNPAGEFLSRGEVVDVATRPALRECLIAGALCNDASLLHDDGRWIIQGDPTEAALVVSARKAGLKADALAEQFPRIDVIPFESERQFMATLHAPPGAAPSGTPPSRLIYVKGSVERVLAMCTAAWDANGREWPLDAQRVHADADEMSRAGLRVLALARCQCPADCEELTHELLARGLTFLGLQGMHDPPRPEAIEAVAQCRGAGIAVKMITGDHASTAAAIAERIKPGPGLHPGLPIAPGAGAPVPADGSYSVVTGAMMAQVADSDLPELTERTHVFARMTPEQKLRLVRALQSRGHVVAMTGDGVNDAPALRQADIGVAMGLTGTEVAKEAADMVLADDNFASIEAAVEEGRTVFDNLTKFIVWTLPTNVGEGMIILTGIAVTGYLAVLPVQALYINMSTALLIGMPLIFERKEADIMSRPPRDPQQPIMTHELFMRTGLMSILLTLGGYGLFEWANWRGMSEAQARTVAVSVVVFGQSFYLFNCRSLIRSVWSVGWFSNPWVWAGFGSMIALQFAFAHTPLLNKLFRAAPLDLPAWGMVVAVAGVIAMIVAFEKRIRRKVAERKARA